MNRSKLRRPFGTRNVVQPDREQRNEERAARNAAVAELVRERNAGQAQPRCGQIAQTVTPVPKSETKRNSTLLEMARGRECLLLCVAHCHGPGMRSETTVACHRNEGKGMALKQSDAMTCWGCAACHEWYDRSGAPKAEKRRAFMAAHLRQVLEWRRIASDPAEPARFRNAARWALDQLNAVGVI